MTDLYSLFLNTQSYFANKNKNMECSADYNELFCLFYRCFTGKTVNYKYMNGRLIDALEM